MSSEQFGSQRKIELISRDVDRYINTFQTSAKWYRWYYFVTSLSTVVLSAIITVIAGWNGGISLFGWTIPIHTDPKNIILLVGALSTVVSAYGLFYSPKKSWLIYQDNSNST